MDDDISRRVLDTFVALADTLASDYDITDFLHFLVGECVAAFGATVGGVLLEGPRGGLELAAGTSEPMDLLERWEMEHGQGPCIDAYRRREQVLVEDFEDTHGRWPEFTPKVLGLGMRAGFGFPLRLRDDCLGALNLYRDRPGGVDPERRRLAQAFADVAAVGILQQRAIADAERRADQLQYALDSRVVIEQAKGVLSVREGITMAAAFEALRRHARDNRTKLHDVANQVIEGLEL